MKNVVLELGGELQIGDLIGMADDVRIKLAWYVSATKGGNLKVINIHVPQVIETHFSTYLKDMGSSHLDNMFKNGFTFESIPQSVIYNTYLRAVKIENPEKYIVDKSVLDRYKLNKDILLKLNFPAK